MPTFLPFHHVYSMALKAGGVRNVFPVRSNVYWLFRFELRAISNGARHDAAQPRLLHERGPRQKLPAAAPVIMSRAIPAQPG